MIALLRIPFHLASYSEGFGHTTRGEFPFIKNKLSSRRAKRMSNNRRREVMSHGVVDEEVSYEAKKAKQEVKLVEKKVSESRQP
jgi:hypothetical protein